jgi:hypothetical protein
MEGFREALRVWAGKLTEGARGRFASLGAWIKERMGEMSPRRALAVVVALSLWMGVGRMDSSESVIVADGEVFGEVHWYEG